KPGLQLLAHESVNEGRFQGQAHSRSNTTPLERGCRLGSGFRWLLAVSLGVLLLASATAAAALTTTKHGAGINPAGIARGPDGNLWLTEPHGRRIGKIPPA